MDCRRMGIRLATGAAGILVGSCRSQLARRRARCRNRNGARRQHLHRTVRTGFGWTGRRLVQRRRRGWRVVPWGGRRRDFGRRGEPFGGRGRAPLHRDRVAGRARGATVTAIAPKRSRPRSPGRTLRTPRRLPRRAPRDHLQRRRKRVRIGLTVTLSEHGSWTRSAATRAVARRAQIGSTWTWVTGEPWVYTDWAAGEPSGTINGTIEDRLQFRGEDGTRQPRQTLERRRQRGVRGIAAELCHRVRTLRTPNKMVGRPAWSVAANWPIAQARASPRRPAASRAKAPRREFETCPLEGAIFRGGSQAAEPVGPIPNAAVHVVRNGYFGDSSSSTTAPRSRRRSRAAEASRRRSRTSPTGWPMTSTVGASP